MNGLLVGFQAACTFPPCGRIIFASLGEPAIPLHIGRSPISGWFHSFGIYSSALLSSDVFLLFSQKSNPLAKPSSPSLGIVLHGSGRLGSLVLGGNGNIQLYVSSNTFNQIRFTILCPRGNVSGTCSLGQANGSGISSVTCPQPQTWVFGTSSDCSFNLIGTSQDSSGLFASQAPLNLSLITPSYIRKYNQVLSGFVDSQTLIDATGCASSVAVRYGSRQFIFTARTWSGFDNSELVSSPVFEINGTTVVEIESMRAAVPRAIDVAAVESNEAIYVAYASELSTSKVFVYRSGILGSPTVIDVAIGQGALFSHLFKSNNFLYAIFCSVSTMSSMCNLYNIQENSAQ